MKVRIVLCLITMLGLLAACKKEKSGAAMPPCIDGKITGLRNDSIAVDSVLLYAFNGRNVYVLKVNQCCDIPSAVLDNNCNQICEIAGFAVNQDCEGKNFDSAATFISTVWRR